MKDKQTVAILASVKRWNFNSSHIFFFTEGVVALPPMWERALELLNTGKVKIGPKCRVPVLRVLAFCWQESNGSACTPPVFHSLN